MCPTPNVGDVIDLSNPKHTRPKGKISIIETGVITVEENKIKYTPISKKEPTYSWARTCNIDAYECSSKGDKRFSAFYARLSDGRTIEAAYQLDIKGYRKITNNLMEAKGKPPLIKMTREELWKAYKGLWEQWANENPQLIQELAELARGKTLTDMFATSEISQARALAEILNEKFG